MVFGNEDLDTFKAKLQTSRADSRAGSVRLRMRARWLAAAAESRCSRRAPERSAAAPAAPSPDAAGAPTEAAIASRDRRARGIAGRARRGPGRRSRRGGARMADRDAARAGDDARSARSSTRARGDRSGRARAACRRATRRCAHGDADRATAAMLRVLALDPDNARSGEGAARHRSPEARAHPDAGARRARQPGGNGAAATSAARDRAAATAERERVLRHRAAHRDVPRRRRRRRAARAPRLRRRESEQRRGAPAHRDDRLRARTARPRAKGAREQALMLFEQAAGAARQAVAEWTAAGAGAAQGALRRVLRQGHAGLPHRHRRRRSSCGRRACATIRRTEGAGEAAGSADGAGQAEADKIATSKSFAMRQPPASIRAMRRIARYFCSIRMIRDRLGSGPAPIARQVHASPGVSQAICPRGRGAKPADGRTALVLSCFYRASGAGPLQAGRADINRQSIVRSAMIAPRASTLAGSRNFWPTDPTVALISPDKSIVRSAMIAPRASTLAGSRNFWPTIRTAPDRSKPVALISTGQKYRAIRDDRSTRFDAHRIAKLLADDPNGAGPLQAGRANFDRTKVSCDPR